MIDRFSEPRELAWATVELPETVRGEVAVCARTIMVEPIKEERKNASGQEPVHCVSSPYTIPMRY